jgi:hypothetical protein
VNIGVRSRNQIREELGDDPDSSKMADALTVTTAAGITPIDTDSAIAVAQQKQEALGPKPGEDDEPPPRANGNGNGKQPKKKVSKRSEVRIDSDVLTPDGQRAATHISQAVHKVFRRQQERAKQKAGELMKVSKVYASVEEVPSYVPKDKRAQWRDIWNSVYAREKKKGKSNKEAESLAFAEASGVAGPHAKVLLLAKADEDEKDRIERELQDAIGPDWQSLPVQIQKQLEDAVLAGIAKGTIEIEVTDAGMIASANEVAREYAADRAAEMVGMKYDEDGNLVANPDAKWAISDTTRTRLREIIEDAFKQPTNLRDVERDIQAALAEESEGQGIFSEARAHLIGVTEAQTAQIEGNWSIWLKTRVIRKLKWLVSLEHTVPDECDLNRDVVVDFGQPFPTGHTHPLLHPRCGCSVVAVEFAQ